MKMYSWALSPPGLSWKEDALKKGLETGQLRIAGFSSKSVMYQMKFNSNSWQEWERTFTVLPKRSYTGKWICGKIMVRRNIFIIHDDGTEVIEYATCKEAFKDNLKNG